MRTITSLHADRLEDRHPARKPISLDGIYLHERYLVQTHNVSSPNCAAIPGSGNRVEGVTLHGRWRARIDAMPPRGREPSATGLGAPVSREFQLVREAHRRRRKSAATKTPLRA